MNSNHKINEMLENSQDCGIKIPKIVAQKFPEL